jgi:hypothetical protein
LLGLSLNNVKQLMFKMAKAGEIAKTRRGQYTVCPPITSITDNPTGKGMTGQRVAESH